jgi:hypothetical protein
MNYFYTLINQEENTMHKFATLTVLFFLAIPPGGNAIAGDGIVEELDNYWMELSRTVTDGEFDAYVNGYHADAVYVSLSSGESYPISKALAGWEQGFIDTREGKSRVGLEFRFSHRLHDATSAHETGMFRYSSQAEGANEEIIYIHFEALLVKKDRWLTLMEYQKTPASQEEWDALK